MIYHKWDGLMKIRYELVIEWIATVVLIAGVALTALNIYPLNVYVSIAGNFFWLVVALMWRKWSLITIQSVVLVIYVLGLFSKGIL